MKLSKEQIAFILDSNPAAIDAAIIILANNQTSGDRLLSHGLTTAHRMFGC